MTKKIVITGTIIGLIMLVLGLGLSRVYTSAFPTLEAEYVNPNLFRSWSDPIMSWYFVHPILVGLFLAWIWDKTKILFQLTLTPLQKGIRFGFIYWLFSICGMIMTYSSFPVSLLMVGTWTFSILIEGLIAAVVLSKLNS